MTTRGWWLSAIGAVAVAFGLWATAPRSSQADMTRESHDDDKGGHVHVPAPLPYADAHIPPTVWTDPALIARGKEIYAAKCAVCHGDAGDGVAGCE